MSLHKSVSLSVFYSQTVSAESGLVDGGTGLLLDLDYDKIYI